MANKVIYVRKADESFWKRAEEKAARDGDALSSYLTKLVRKDVLSASTQQVPTPAELAARIAADLELLRAQAETAS